MYSTHYMDLLMQNSPWNLLLFMALPVVFAETAAITELWAPHAKSEISKVRLQATNRICGILGGIAFLFIDIYLIATVFIPLALAHEFRTWIDVVAITSYLLGGIPMMLLALLNTKVLWRKATEQKKAKANIVLLASFLVLSHIAMIFGMVDPGIAGYAPKEAPAHQMGHHMNHQMSPAEHQTTPAATFQMPAGMDHSQHQMQMEHSGHQMNHEMHGGMDHSMHH